MKHLKVTSIVLSIAICMSMFMPTVSVLADEAAAPSETQSTEETEKQTPKETEKPAPKTTEKKETEPSEKKETEVTEKPVSQETEEQEPAQTEKQEPSETAEEQKPSETEETTPAETDEQKPEQTEKQPEETTVQEPSESETEEAVVTEAPVQETEVKKGAKDVAEAGSCGPKLNWYYTDGVLEINGSGEMTSHPWTDNYKTSITKVIIGSDVKTIVDYAFYGCKNLATVDLSSASALYNIGLWSFSGCTSLTSINVPSGVSFIDQGAFSGCTKLKSVKLNGNMGLITYDVFENCSSLTEINIPDQVDTINYAAFKGCSSLTELKLPSTVKIIGQEAFSGCAKLSQINIPSNVSDISDKVFYGCSSLTTITLSEHVTRIGNNAFDGCSKLKSVTLPASLEVIWRRAFADCSALTDVYYLGTDEQWNRVDIYVENTPLFNATLHTQGSSTFTGAQGTCGEKLTWALSKDGTLTISGSGAMDDFEGNQYGTGSSAIYFYQAPWNDYKNKVKKVVFDGSVTYIGNGAFNGCLNLTSISLPKSLTSIGKEVFTNSGVTSITIPSGITSIPANAFNSCINLKTVTIPSTVNTIGTMAFANCLSLSTVYLADGVTTISERAFENCTSLKSISLPDTVTMIGTYAFNSSGLTEITIPGYVTSFGMFAFVKCSSLTSVVISSGVNTIASNAFSECDKLTSVTIPESVYTLDYAFLNSNNIKHVYYEGSQGDWDNLIYSAYGVSELQNATIHCNSSGATHYKITLGAHDGGSVTFTPANPVAGDTVTINATPDEGYVYDYFVLDGYMKSGKTFVMPASNVEVDVIFKSEQHSITVKYSSGGTASCPVASAGVGGEIIIKCNPDDEHVFGYMTVNGVEYSTNSFIMPAEDVIVYVTFVEGGYPIILKDDGHGTAELSKKVAKPGDIITVTPKPSTGYELDKIVVNGTPLGSGVTKFTMGETSTTVEISFKKIQYKINVSVPNGGGTAYADPASAGLDDTVTVKYSSNVGYDLDKIVVNGTALTDGTTSFTLKSAETKVVVSFKKINYTVTVKPAEHGSVTVSKTTANYGDKITVTATPESGYVVGTIKVNGVALKSGVTEFTMGDANTTVEASFKTTPLPINVSVPNGGGTASASPAEACLGETVEVEYVPDTGYELDKIVVNGTALASGTTSFTMASADTKVVVSFKKASYDVGVTASEGGSAKANVTKAGYGDTIKITYTANDGYEFDKITLNGTKIDGTTFSMPAGKANVAVYFTKGSYSVSVSAPEGGTAKANAEKAEYGEQVKITYTASAGYELDKITVNGSEIDGVTFDMPAENVAVVVYFKKIFYPVTLKVGSNGTASVSADSANYGDIITVTAKADAGYVLDAIKVNGTTLASGKFEFTMGTGKAAVEVSFKAKQIDINVSVPQGGSAKTNPASASVGDSVTVIPTPDKGYKLDKITLNGVSIEGTKFTMPAGEANVVVYFKLIDYDIELDVGDNGTATVSKNPANYGDIITVDATPSAGYVLDAIKVNGTALKSGVNTFTMGAAAATVSVTFKKTQYAVGVTVSGVGGTASAKTSAAAEEWVEVNCVPDTGYEVDKILVNDAAITGTGFPMPAKPANVVVSFKKAVYNVSVNKPVGGTATLSKTQASYGESITVTPKANTGYELDKIYVNGTALKSGTSFTMPAEDAEVEVTFKQIEYAVTIDCGANGTASVDKNPACYGDTVVITATPSNGFTIDYIKVNGTALVGTMKFTMGNAPATVEVSFKQAQFTISTSVSGGNGTATVVKMANEGDMIAVECTPKTGYTVDKILVNDAAITGMSFKMPAKNTTVVVSFKPAVYDITINKPTGGTATLSKTSANYGELITVTAVPSSGYELDSITVNGETIEIDAFSMPDEKVSVVVTFKKIDYEITVENPVNGTASVDKNPANSGDKITITAKPVEGYTIDTIKVNGTALKSGVYTFTMGAAPATVEVTFKKIQHSITVKCSAGGTAVAEPKSAGINDIVTINCTPSAGYEVDKILVNNEESGKTFLMPNANTTVNVSFKKIDYTILVTADNGEAEVTKNPANVNDKITVNYSANPGYTLDYIKVNETTLKSGVTTFTMGAGDTRVEVHFKLKDLKVKVTALPGGTATASADTAKMGETVTLTVNPADGYKIDYIMVNNRKASTSFEMGAEDAEVTVAFAKIPYEISLTVGANGKATVDKTVAVIGDKITVDVTPDEDYYEIIKVNGETISGKEFEMPASNVTVTVTFERLMQLSVGESGKVGSATFTVTGAAPENGTGTVRLDKFEDNGTAAVEVPSIVKIKGYEYRVTSIADYAFANNQSMTSLKIGDYVVSVGNYSVYNCRNLVRVYGGLRLKTIGTKAFAGCAKLKSFTVSSAVLSKISAYTFYGDKSLKTIYVNKTTKLSKKGVKKSLKGSKIKTVKVKKSKVRKYKKIFTKKNCGRKVKVKK